jgi:hypothetical protein
VRRYGESTHHEKLKERIGQILQAKGWTVFVDSYTFKCQTAKGERNYTPDVYAETPEYERWRLSLIQSGQGSQIGSDNTQENDTGRGREKRQDKPPGATRAILEVQGSKGKGNHSTKHHQSKDTHRINDIRTEHGTDIHYVPLWDWEIKGFTDKEVWEQIEYLLKTLKD